MRQFAEEEIVLPPGGPVQGRYRIAYQPIDRLLYDEIDSGRWTRIAVTGPVQSGKTLKGSVLPVMYHAFEVKENVAFGLPTMDMARDKWRDDLLPVIERSRYRDLLPTSGSGSRGGGRFESITFRNGVTLKFMSAHGGDEKRSGFTTRVLVVTEADKMDESSDASREADPLRQLEARTFSFESDRRRIYLECTVSIEEGRIWQEITKGSDSRLVSPCVHCGAWVTPEREHFAGWEEAETDREAGRRGRFFCPECGEGIDDEQRRRMIDATKLVHRGQEIDDDGTISGEAPDTYTLGFRYSVFHNRLWRNKEIAEQCWSAARAEDEESAERQLTQFVWVKPYKPPKNDLTPLKPDEIKSRVGGYGRGVVPPDARFLTLGCDVGKWYLHWTCIAWTPLRPYVIDYDTTEVPSDKYGEEVAIPRALAQLRDRAMVGGWFQAETGQRMHPSQSWVDAQHWTDLVEGFCREAGSAFRPAHGRGESQTNAQHYGRKTTTGKTVEHVGEQFHIQRNEVARLYEVIVNVDHWKSKLHRSLAAPLAEVLENADADAEKVAASLVFFQANNANDHLRFAKHLTSEKQTEQFIHGRGNVIVWEKSSGQNHWLDSSMLAFVAGHFCGWPIRDEAPEPVQPQPVSRPGLTLPGGRPWIPRR